ncbi:enolase 1-like [Hordeum vulgare subsp. vulgare]|uniref:enolase 1-like n=1 Tax=Hordeum vulgare subsp. vulgare TaxID=112509 RepID=UPI001D1A33A8|nr:enolase 1-like [Hordeum vulgare subsp. vulgare]
MGGLGAARELFLIDLEEHYVQHYLPCAHHSMAATLHHLWGMHLHVPDSHMVDIQVGHHPDVHAPDSHDVDIQVDRHRDVHAPSMCLLPLAWTVVLPICNPFGWAARVLVNSVEASRHGRKHITNLAGNKTLVPLMRAFNVINGGSHAGNKLAMQEFMILPTGAASFKEAMKMGVEVYHHLKSIIKKKYGQDSTNVGDEGGFAPNIQENKEGLELLKAAIAKAGYTGKVVIGMDVDASEFYSEKDQTYDLNFKEDNNDGSHKISGDSLKDLYKSFVSEYPIMSIEDPFDQDDWATYTKMAGEVGQQVQIVGDDLLVTNPTRVAKAIS